MPIRAESTCWSAHVERSDKLEVGEFCPRQPYLELQVPQDAQTVRRLSVVTISHDQGFSDSQDVHGGTYAYSNSWFELHVVTSSYHERTNSRGFQYNRHAVLEPCRHKNMWDASEGDEATRAWLSSFKAGDTIQIIPRADFKLWMNYVYNVEIAMVGDRRTNDPQIHPPQLQEDLYQPLDAAKHETRLLSLHSGSGQEALRCSMKTISVDDSSHEDYEALSYCWGADTRDSSVHVRYQLSSINSEERGPMFHEVSINKSLHEALTHLRPASGPPRSLWADAICINQADTKERSYQVTQMPSIYGKATRVIIWLGPSSPMRRDCFDKVQAIEERFRREDNPSRVYTLKEIERVEDDLVTSEMPLEVLMSFPIKWRQCEFEWFRRTWVLQEVANARTAIVCCGDQAVSWPAISALARHIRRHKRLSGLLLFGIMPSIFSDFSRPMDGDRGRGRSVLTTQGILDYLILALGLKAGDSRDRIFALLQFGTETSEIAHLPLLIRPDYNKSVTQVYTDFVRWWICEHKSLRVLSAIHTLKGRSWQQMYYGDPQDLSELAYPTWCFWYGGQANWARATLALNPDSTYKASGSSEPDLELIASDGAVSESFVLRLTGYRLCRLERITPYPFWTAGTRPEEQGLHRAFESIFDPSGMKRAWLVDRDDQEIQQSTPGTMSEYQDRHLTYHWRGFNGRSASIPCVSHSLFFGGQAANSQVGLCPHTARPGDVVVMLHGGPVLYLLREKSVPEQMEGQQLQGVKIQWEFVGESYLTGYMDGQALEEAEQGMLEGEIFELV
ncbi:hypothetical protein N0V93_002863 [Gnomoniopsis smithogilvyi]|uniref:Heterokaryon incompatibility domain-containing protein n=1 Tax=Gnomoniopsis smithogilvyi TaxID=1191159 RepID=A0A9W8YVJ4_9PEZI|nr:hypothetical protein N0V93_002863 [Gnomoniopsis smithogilvyi]